MPNSNEKNFVVIYLLLLSPFTIFVTYYEKDGGILMKHTTETHDNERGADREFMKSARNKIICLLLFVVGLLMLGGGVYGFVSLSKASGAFGHATGVIEKISSKREYRHRKMRIHTEMRISYETERYGKMYVNEECYWPFRSEGDSIGIIYRPDNPYDIRVPGEERCIWLTLMGVGALCLAGVWLMLRPQRRADRQIG